MLLLVDQGAGTSPLYQKDFTITIISIKGIAQKVMELQDIITQTANTRATQREARNEKRKETGAPRAPGWIKIIR